MWHSHHIQYLTHGWINTLRIKLVLALPWPPLYMPVLLFSPASWNQSVLEMKRLAGSEFENQVGKEYKNVQIHLLKCVFFYFPLFTVLGYFDSSVFLLSYFWSVSGSTTPSLSETSFCFSSLLFSLWFLWYFLYRCSKDPVNSSALISYVFESIISVLTDEYPVSIEGAIPPVTGGHSLMISNRNEEIRQRQKWWHSSIHMLQCC